MIPRPTALTRGRRKRLDTAPVGIQAMDVAFGVVETIVLHGS